MVGEAGEISTELSMSSEKLSSMVARRKPVKLHKVTNVWNIVIRNAGVITVPNALPSRKGVPPEELAIIVFYRIRVDMKDNAYSVYISFLTDQPHIAGTERDIRLARYIGDLWTEQGLDQVKLVPYNVLLSYPNPDKANEISIVNDQGEVSFIACHEEKILQNKFCIQPFNAYSPKGDILADPLYVNYGRDEDFDLLEELGISIKGKICLARYGKIYRGKKVSNAAKRGALGMILFLCPTEVAVCGTNSENVYPNTWWMPSDAIQRGDIREEKGDPQTPGYPSLDDAYRIPVEEINDFPKIPCQPIGYGDALAILQQLGGNLLPEDWTTRNKDILIGPGFKDSEKKLRLIVNNEFKQAVCYNVIGIIEGAVEPDRYVLLGNHRDAWVYGGADPSSGTAQMCEVSRVLGTLKKEGWKPNRTIVFCSWDGEEFGLIGSTEWIEEHMHSLQARAVAYINVDICVAGEIFHPEASALLEDFLTEIADLVNFHLTYVVLINIIKISSTMFLYMYNWIKIPDPKQSTKSTYEVWKDYMIKFQRQVRVDSLGPGTDHIPFYFYAGIPSINLSWLPDTEKYPTLFLHPAYHTAYDNFDTIDRLIDPGFLTHRACARLCCLLLYHLANCHIIPYNVEILANRIEEAWIPLRNQLQEARFRIDHLEKAILDFKKASRRWKSRLNCVDIRNSYAVRRANDQMMLLERIFVKSKQYREINIIRHMIFTPYQRFFPSLINLLSEYRKSPEEKIKQLLEKNISDIMIALKSAEKFLFVTDF
ncbi:N-acetylated-alpha-linked acidic dipeptidase 2-like [Centruroides sculpturatus]|uniref:N-acetylated-alpha-linked acidic dipeptidase 2-like n=1 Tax=Centruroides sculpturatus TaxID=218467 RepID=UPI000C6D2182|nr:N-acetylated-alpha-linked acidic dipeptidase 2-like [Centruroides sculpturatus]